MFGLGVLACQQDSYKIQCLTFDVLAESQLVLMKLNSAYMSLARLAIS